MPVGEAVADWASITAKAEIPENAAQTAAKAVKYQRNVKNGLGG
jgi:hypothetical protein